VKQQITISRNIGRRQDKQKGKLSPKTAAESQKYGKIRAIKPGISLEEVVKAGAEEIEVCVQCKTCAA